MEKEKARGERSFSNKIVIGLCTYYRNELLDGALESLSRIDLPADVGVEFVLVDNDPDGGARPVFEYYADAFPFKAHYFVEPNQGLVCARNRVLEEALKLGATEIAFFDDDEIIVSKWLTALWDIYSRSFVSGVGGPVYRLLPVKHDVLLEKFWQNLPRYTSVDAYLISTNNCLFSTHLVSQDGFALRFDPFFNQIGGEDGRFALEAFTRGAAFNFTPEAIAVERFTEQRATFSYLLKRHFGGGSLIPLLMRSFGKAPHWKYALPSMFSCMWRMVFIPVSIGFGRFQFWKNLVRLVAAAGTFVGCFGYSYRHYVPRKRPVPRCISHDVT
ncbi:MAG: glycosyltransferase family 2 protein [Puniceicoccales bacterium]|jgi:succinoglycan biosynthesis protein ExoM|nr:glycosyltransferase family 2 protein [Puniceicoccales bacterium]